MAAVTTELKVLVKAVGKGELKELEASLNKLAVTAKTKVSVNFKDVSKQLKDIQSTSTKSTRNLRDYRNAWRDIASQLDVATKDFKEATAEAARLDAQLARVEKRNVGGPGGGGRFASAGKSAAAIAGSAVFGGPEGAIAATVGSAFGPGGAIAGGFVGAQISQVRKAAGGIGEYVAELNLAKAALAGVSKDQEEYNKNVAFAGELSDKYAIRIKDVIKGYTGVTAAAKANNLSLEQTQAIYEGITVSGVAAGKSQEDLQALFLATTQVLSKGKASAEEISGQIGERIPGAVAKFAAANKISLGELARQFKAGEVTIAKFVKFTEQQGEDYAEVAAALATGPEKAGVRLEIALDKVKEAYGSLFLNVGAGVQDLFTKIVEFVIDNETQFKKYIAIGVAFGQDFIEIITGVAKATFEIFKALGQTIRFIFGDLFSDIGRLLVFFVQKTANLLRKARAERGAREKGTDLLAVRREAEAEVVAEDGGRDYLSIEQSGRINKKYFEKLGVITGDAFAGSFGDRVNALVKSLSDARKYTFAKPSNALPILEETEGGGDKSKGSAKADANRVGRAILGIEKMMAKLKSMNANLKLSAEAVGATAEEEIKIKYEQSLQKAIDVTEGLNNQLIKYEDTIGRTVPEVREELNKLRMAYVDLADAERASALFGNKLKGYGFTGEALDAGGKIFAAGALDEQAFPAGVDSILNPNKLKESIQEIKKELEELTNPVNQIINAATTIGTAFSDSFKSVIDGSATTQEALAGFFENISNYFLDMAMQIIQKMITMYVLNQAIGLLPGLGSTGSGFNLSGFGSLSGDSVSGASGFLNAASINPFAKGGIMGQSGPMDLKRYARGGVANSPQLAMFGEGSTPEAYVPLPDGRSIPVTMRGAGSGVQVGAINITVENTGDQLNPAAQKQLAGQVKGIVLSTLANERRSGGML